MEQRRLGRLGHVSSVLIYGGAALSDVAQDVADGSIEFALDAGINHFDTAADEMRPPSPGRQGVEGGGSSRRGSLPLGVHSLKPTCATTSGRTQCTSLVDRPFVSVTGEADRSSGARRPWCMASSRSLKPVPTFPPKRSSPSS